MHAGIVPDSAEEINVLGESNAIQGWGSSSSGTVRAKANWFQFPPRMGPICKREGYAYSGVSKTGWGRFSAWRCPRGPIVQNANARHFGKRAEDQPTTIRGWEKPKNMR